MLCSVCCFSLNRLYNPLGPSDTQVHTLIEKSLLSPSGFAYNERNSLMLCASRKAEGNTGGSQAVERCVSEGVALTRGGTPPGSAQRRAVLCYSILAPAALHPYPLLKDALILSLEEENICFCLTRQSFTRITSTFCSKNYFNLK